MSSAQDAQQQQRLWTFAALATVGIASSALTAFSIYSYQSHSRKRRRKDLSDSLKPPTHQQQLEPPKTPQPSSSTSSLTSGTTPKYLSLLQLQQSQSHSKSTSRSAYTPIPPRFIAQSYPEALIKEQLARHYSFFSPETLQQQRSLLPTDVSEHQSEQLGMPAIRSAFVIVVGLGGVGSHAALSLLRSGISYLRLVDFDQVSLSSLNRHACATLADVGRPKVTICQEKLMAIAPWAHIEIYNELFSAAQADRLLTSFSTTGRKPDFIIDAIDNIDTKVDLIAYAYNHQIRIITASGAGAKSDPSRIQIADLSATSEDPLARAVRRRLRLQGIPKLRDRVGEGGGTAPRARTLKRRELKAQQQSKEEENGSRTDSRPDTPKLPSSSSFSLGDGKPTPMEAYKTPISSPFAIDETDQPPPTQGNSDADFAASMGMTINTNPAALQRGASIQHSRRASSASSGEGRFETPLMSPTGLLSPAAPASPVGGDKGSTPPSPSPVRLPRSVVSEATTLTNGNDADRKHPDIDEEAVEDEEAEAEEEGEGSGPEEEGTQKLKKKGEPYSRTRKPHSHALNPTALIQTSRQLDRETGHNLTLPCVFSTEKSDVRLLDVPESEVGKGKIEELAALEDFRVRVLPVFGPIPAMFGLAAASYVLCEIAGWPMEPLPFLNRRKMYDKMLSDLEVAEKRFPHTTHSTSSTSKKANSSNKTASTASNPNSTTLPHKFPFSLTDIAYLTEEVFHSRSCVPPSPVLTTAAVLLRWDSTLPLGFNNVVLLTRDEAKKHSKEVLGLGRSPWEVWGRAVGEEWNRRMAAERRMQGFR
ncbi:hypothetical protein OC846_001862 [Tilletia horrida]|uniref:THIF-type NAD/FAD binding fold domain-containing protein n=1 Tax=Tilletia horrida TaxID=155126 RepID=A0AAN6GVM6_9BASI|nr:hypothetical protein OC846_001862 [Tilletia horrida]KAK0568379.1 hypothetical protein OC861_002008 [Tilletia horrida]